MLICSEDGLPHLLLFVPWPHRPSIALRGQSCGQDYRGCAFVHGLFDGANWFCGRIPLGRYTVARGLYEGPRCSWSQAPASASVVGMQPPTPSALTSVLGAWPSTFWPWVAHLARPSVYYHRVSLRSNGAPFLVSSKTGAADRSHVQDHLRGHPRSRSGHGPLHEHLF